MARTRNLKRITTFNVGLYLRISVEEERREKESNSITNQRKLLSDYVRSNHDMVFVKEYIDDGFTGTNFERPGFKTMIQDAMDGKINCIIVKDLSRFGREHIDTERYIIRVFRDMGVRFIAVCDDYDSLVKGYDMMFSIRNLFNEHYAQDISQKCQSAFKAKQRSGEFIGAFASYGYVKSKKNKHMLELDPYAAGIVKKIFSLYLHGMGQVRIARVLNEEGVLCPSEYKKQNGDNYRNAKRLDKTNYWTYSTVHKILKHEMYTGTMIQGKTKREMHGKPYLLDESEWIKVENTHPAIIEREEWEKVQKLMKQKTTDLGFDENQSVFAGFLKCGDCGRAMCKKNHKNTKGETFYDFNCGTYVRVGKNACSSHYIREDVLKRIVLDDLNQIIAMMTNLKEVVEQAKEKAKSLDNTAKLYDEEIEKSSMELQKIRKLKQKVFEEYALGTISGQEYSEYREQYIQKEKQLESKLSELQGKQEQRQDVSVFELPWIKKLMEHKKIEELTRDIIVEMVDVIYIYIDKRIKIRYNFSDEYEGLMQTVYEA